MRKNTSLLVKTIMLSLACLGFVSIRQAFGQKVGINTSTPTATLDVNGNTKTDSLQITTGAVDGHLLRSDASGNATWVNPTALPNGNWTTNGTNQFSALSGNVGIGTTLPTEKLHVVGSALIDAGRLSFKQTGESVFVGEEAGQHDNMGLNKNVFVGHKAGYSNEGGLWNVAIGHEALFSNSGGVGNVALGRSAGHSIVSGVCNTTIGLESGFSLTTGSLNTLIGRNAAFLQTNGNQNIVIGNASLYSNTSGSGNIVVGDFALSSTTSSENNIAIGHSAGISTTGNSNIFLGNGAGASETGSSKLYIENSTSTSPLILGDFEHDYLTVNGKLGVGTSSFNTESNLILAGNSHLEGGQLQLNSSTSGSTAYFLDNYQDAFRILAGTNSGSSTLQFYLGSTGKVGLGTNAPGEKLHLLGNLRIDGGKLQFTNTGLSMYIGEAAGNADDINDANDLESLAIGKEALYSSTEGFQNIGIGIRSLRNLTIGESNIAIGADALQYSTEANYNIAIGQEALESNTLGNYNIAIGSAALDGNTTGVNNVGIGYGTGSGNQAGSDNVFMGDLAGTNNEGSGNTIIGSSAGENCIGSGNVLIGFKAGGNATGSDKLYIDNSNTSSPLIWGDFANNYLNFNANVGIGTNSPTQAKLVVNGSMTNTMSYAYLNSFASIGTCANCTGTYSIYANSRVAASEFNAFSDYRIKKNLRRTDNLADLNTLMALQITDYQMVDSIAKGNKTYKKVIAQEVAKVYPGAVSTMSDVIPDIYQLAGMERGFVYLDKCTLLPGDKVRLILWDRQEMATVQSVSDIGFQTDLADAGTVFVYGREVSDFHSVDYEALTTLNISATQALVRQVGELKKERDELKTMLGSLSSRLEALEALQSKPQLTATTKMNNEK